MSEDWRKSAACRDEDPELFFPGGDNPRDSAWDPARAICRKCPLWAKEACLDDALAEEGRRGVQSRFGMRGGLTPSERYTRATGHISLSEHRAMALAKREATRGRIGELMAGGMTVPQVAVAIGMSLSRTEVHVKAMRELGDLPPVEPRPCGTRAAYRRHIRAGETACEECLLAERRVQRARPKRGQVTS